MRRLHSVVLLVVLLALTPVLVGCGGSDSDFFDLNTKKRLTGERKELFPEGVPGVTQGLPPEYINKKPKQAAAQKPASDQESTAEQSPSAFHANTPDGVPYPEASAPSVEAAAPNAEAAAPNAEAAAPAQEGAAPAQPSKTAAVEPVEEPKPKAKPKHKPKQRAAAPTATQATVKRAAKTQNGGQQQSAPWPDQKQAESPWPDQKQPQSQWPDQKQAQSAPPAQEKSMSSVSPWPSAPPPGTFSR